MSETPDSASFRAWAWPRSGTIKTICLVGQRAKDPSAIGSKGDRDTASCRGWPSVSPASASARSQLDAPGGGAGAETSSESSVLATAPPPLLAATIGSIPALPPPSPVLLAALSRLGTKL